MSSSILNISEINKSKNKNKQTNINVQSYQWITDDYMAERTK